MREKVFSFLFGLILGCCLVTNLWSSSVYFYNFNTYTGALGSFQIYTDNGAEVSVYGFDANGNAHLLYGYSDSNRSTNGLGLSGKDQKGFIQLDVSKVWMLNPNEVDLSLGGVGGGESWNVYGSNSKGALGQLLFNGVTDINTGNSSQSISNSYQYLSIQAQGGSDILLNNLSATISTPEPSTLLVLGVFCVLIVYYRLGFRSLLRKDD